jgi:hypothetical protein
MKSRTIVADSLKVTTDIYGKYNRKITAITDEGLLQGIVREEDCGGLGVGTYDTPRLIRIYESPSGLKLVESILDPAK